MQEISSNKMFEGHHKRFTHKSELCDCEMTFAVYLPPQAETEKVPVIYWLSGLTCTDENFGGKSGAQRYAAEEGVAIVMPDTSPRGVNLPGEDERYDFGSGAGFYLNATREPWSRHYHMYDYVVKELPALVAEHLPVNDERVSISGHSMGGHGALTIALKNPDRYRAVSAFAPIVAPTQVPWGINAFRGYLGDNENHWKDYDAVELIRSGKRLPEILVEQGDQDQFLEKQLKPELLEQACKEAGIPLTLNSRPGYDHSYYFIATFIEQHIRYHARHLKA
ncbi:S-formylglutathione hydrolase [Gilvimarinus sp. F26214L]|uniref:S-formylglutathione hydrolase n=1 Tax=Gilvimarinus sp. DZF01 TaxID=3461371 RepID=UPI004046570E